MIIAHPESGSRHRVVHENSSNVSRPGERIFDELPGFRIQTQDVVGRHRSGPRIAILVQHDIIGSGKWRWRNPFLKAFRPRVEHSDPVATILSEPEMVL